MVLDLTDEQIDNELRRFLTGDDGSVGDSEERMMAAVRGCHSIYNGGNRRGTGLVVVFKDARSRKWNTEDVLPHENPERPGLWRIRYVWDSRHLLSEANRRSLEHLVSEYRSPAQPIEICDLIEQCRKKGISVDLQPLPSEPNYVVEAMKFGRGEFLFSEFSTYADLGQTAKRAAYVALSRCQ